MSRMFYGTLTPLLFCLALPIVSGSPSAYAQVEVGATLEEVVVTARRREESLQDVPLAVTAYSGGKLEELGALDLTYLNQTVPNVTLERSRSTNNTLTAFIRGVGQQDPVAGFEGGVGVYIDDVYLNRPQGSVLDIYDVERIEVLRGPQGTLYGRNTIGGAVRYITRRLTDEPELSVRASVGTEQQLDATATFGLPITDTLRVGGGVARLTRDGFGANLVQPGVENYNKDVTGIRVSIEWEPSDVLFLRFSGDWTEDNSDPRQGHRLLDGQFTPDAFPVLSNVFDTRANLDMPDPEVTNSGVTSLVEWEINDRILLKNILAYRDNDSAQQIDFDSLPVSDIESPFVLDDEQFSEEIQVIFTGEQVDAIVGFYYLDASAFNMFDVILGQTGDLIGLPGLNAFTLGDIDTTTWSIFGDVTFQLADLLDWSGGHGLELSVGARYTNDERTARVLRQTFIGGNSPFFGGDAIAIATTSDFDDREEFTDFTPRVSLAWHPSSEQNLYFSISQGFKGGGFDPRGATTAAPDLDNDGIVDADEIREFMKFEPEEITTYEIGAKSQWLDSRFGTSVAIFSSDYKDVQIPGSIGVDSDGDGLADSFAGVTTNAGKASFLGVELEAAGALAEDLFTSGGTLSGTLSLGWIDAEFDEFIQAVTDPVSGETSLQDVSSMRNIQNTPEWTGNLSLEYLLPLRLFGNSGEFTIINSLSYRGDTSQFEFDSPIDQSAYTLYDASVLWTADDGHMQLGIHGRNLTDKEYKVAGYDFVNIQNPLGLEGTLTAFFGDPRTITGTIQYRF